MTKPRGARPIDTAEYWQGVSLGGSAWPNLKLRSVDEEKAMCAWINGTLGMLLYWIESNRTQAGRGRTTVTAMGNIAVLDIHALDDDDFAALVGIYDEFCERKLLPANEAYHDPVRIALDERIWRDVLHLDDETVEYCAQLREMWCLEPSVGGDKSTALAKIRSDQ